jgi:hypothetical protein
VFEGLGRVWLDAKASKFEAVIWVLWDLRKDL